MLTHKKFNLGFNVFFHYLIPLSLLYLCIPYLIFFTGWLRWYFALPGIILIIIPVFLYFREAHQTLKSKHHHQQLLRINLKHIIISILLALTLLVISGVGGYGYQNSDWRKHNAIFKDLITRPWPVVYKVNDIKSPLVYYIAYYLPAALVGKLGGWFWANQFLFVWTFIGLILAMLWFLILILRAHYFIPFLFAFFSGLDALGLWLINWLNNKPFFSGNWRHIEWWAMIWQYSSHLSLLFWVPNQAVAAWIISAVIIQSILYHPSKRYILFYLSLTLLWSPFITIGVSLYLFGDFLTESGTLLKRISKYISVPNICGFVLMVILSLFYSARFYTRPLPARGNLATGFIFFMQGYSKYWPRVFGFLLLFCFLEFGVYGVMIGLSETISDLKTKSVFFTTMIYLSLLPFYRYGYNNDLVMRASIPALFILSILLVRTLDNCSIKNYKTIILIIFFLIGSITPLVECRRHINRIYRAETILRMKPSTKVQDLWSLHKNVYEKKRGSSFFLQYIGSQNAPFFKYMTKTLHP